MRLFSPIQRTLSLLLGGLCLVAFALFSLGCSTLEPQAAPQDAAGHQSVPPDTPPGDADYYRAENGAVLGYVRYTSPIATTALVFLHGLDDQSGWFAGMAKQLQARGYDVYLLDRRGSGINRENRGFRSGDIDAYPTWIGDIQAFLTPLRERYPAVFLVGASWGGKLAYAYSIARPNTLDGLVLIAPSLHEKVQLGLFAGWTVKLKASEEPQPALPLPIEPAMHTTTPTFLDFIEHDPLRLDRASPRFFQESGRLDAFINEHLTDNHKPTLVLLADQDQIVDNEGTLAILQQGDPNLLEIQVYKEQPHALQFDAVERLVNDMDAWIKKQQVKLVPVRP
ncbi:MAG: alpha/beta fold hydrolase [Gammaproteobacteria bacterium]|nr:alpha/beta fold hydrolase [Gammaproteobacteria bacterium]MCP5424785.1 alpha/beta fold hydrolase [Gammaproteobacteria bacterium]MCP5458238.1 alpha/beta fold hydrolase [Gammaproteobacteria bacterium]